MDVATNDPVEITATVGATMGPEMYFAGPNDYSHKGEKLNIGLVAGAEASVRARGVWCIGLAAR